MKIALFNDTGGFPHFGCLAVSDAHARMLGRAGHTVEHRVFSGWNVQPLHRPEREVLDDLLRDEELLARIAAVDAVVVNGEGTIHHGAGLQLLAALAVGQRLGKATFLVNAVYQETTAFEDVLRRLDDFTVREKRSAEFARSRGIRCRVVLDSCLAARFSQAPIVDLSGKSVATDWHIHRGHDVGRAMRSFLAKRGSRAFYLPFERSDASLAWHRIPKAIATCAEFVSGRHHGIYFALKARKPFVALPSNTFKVEGLLDTFGSSVPVVRDSAGVEDACRWARQNPGAYERIFDQVGSDLDTFKALGGAADPLGEEREVARLARDLEAGTDPFYSQGAWQTEMLSRSCIEALTSSKRAPIVDLARTRRFLARSPTLRALVGAGRRVRGRLQSG